MAIAPETRRHSILPLAAGGLLAAFFFVLWPLSRTADRLDGPLTQSWRALAVALGQTNASRLDFAGLTNQLQEARAAQAVLALARQQALARIELSQDLQMLLRSPFQLVDYENEVRLQMARLAQAAKDGKVMVEPAVWSGFPQPTSSVEKPALLWAELSFLETLLATAISSRVTVVHSVTTMLSPTGGEVADSGPRGLTEIPIQIELTGPMSSIVQVLQVLPLRAEELKAAGMSEWSANKPALFIDRLVLRKQAREKPEEVRVSLRVVGFVSRR